MYKHPLRTGEAHTILVLPTDTPTMDASSWPPEFDTLLADMRLALQGRRLMCQPRGCNEIPADMVDDLP